MPALYRMPVFYLAAMLLASGIGLTLLARGKADGTPAAPRTPEVAPHPAALDIPEAPEPADDGILRTAEGLRRKVVVKELGVVCRDAAENGREVGPPLDYFAIRYLYGEWPDAFLIGPRGGPPQGWVPSRSVLEWDTRLMARPTPREGRPPLVIFREEPCLLDALAGRTCPRHGGHCPTEGQESDETPVQEAASPLGLPILQSRAIPQPDGTTRTIFEVASLVRDRPPPPPPPEEPPADLRPALRQVYIALVIDTTASMQATIDAARRAVDALIADASGRLGDVTLHLALIEYRDQSPSYGFSSRISTPFTDPAGLKKALIRAKAARSGDGSVDEAVLEGVAAALPPAPGEPPGELHLSWPGSREGELATKMLVLIGDAPDHARELRRAKSLASLARNAGITIAAVSIDRPGSLSRDEQARYRLQWHALAEGSYRPKSAAKGKIGEAPPVEVALAKAGELTASLRALILDRSDHARNLVALAQAEAEGRLKEYVNAQGLTLEAIAPVLVDLHRGETKPEARPDPRQAGRKAPSVRRGWIAERSGGRPLVAVEVLMSRPELSTLIDELTQLQQAAQGSARDLSELLKIGVAAAAGETAFLAADRGDRTFADHLRRRQGLPPARPDSLLRRSQADLLQADDLYRSALDARLRASISQLIKRRGSPDWDDPRRTIDGLAPVPYDAIDF